MNKPLGRGLGALLTDRSQEATGTSDKYKAIREKEKQLTSLQENIDNEKKDLEDLRKKLTIELMLSGKVDKTELFRREEAWDEMVKKKDALVREINSLKEEVRSYMKIEGGAGGEGAGNNAQSPSGGDTIPDDIDMRLIRELMPPQGEDSPETPPVDPEHVQGLKRELDRSKQVEVVRKEAYKAPGEGVVRPKVVRVVSPKRVRVIRGTTRTISKRRDERMYDLVQGALDQMTSGDIEGSRRSLENILAEYPNDDEILYHLGNTYFMTEELEEAQALFQKAVEINPSSYRALNNLGVVQEKLENKESAIKSFNQALEIEPDYERAWMNLGSLFMDLDPPLLKEASIFLRRALEIQPGLAKARTKLEECDARLKAGG
ncbi:MAG: tetratricopeptide repeat protein [Thermoplasmatota archaeon]